MRTATFVFVSLSLSQITGCGLIQSLEQKSAFSVGAKPLVIECQANAPASALSPQSECINHKWADFQSAASSALGDTLRSKREYLGFVANESERLCGDFVQELIVAANGTNTGLDMTTTVFSALGTAFTPLSTVHAMTAGSTITSGWKTAIDSDVYAKLTIQNLVQAIQGTYYKDMGNYLDHLTTKNESNIIVTSELGRIRVIHSECTLASAEGTITASLSPNTGTAGNAPTRSAVATLTIAINGGAGAAQPDDLVLTAKSPTIPNIPTIDIPISKSETANQIAAALLSAVVGKISPHVESITAKPGSTPATIQLFSNTTDEITWAATMKAGTKSGVSLYYTPAAPTTPKSGGRPGESVTF